MTNVNKQRGITLMGFVIGLAVVGFLVFMGIRLFPIYSEYYSVVSAMKATQAEIGIANKTPEQIKQSLNNRLYVNYVYTVKAEHIKVSRQGGYTLRVRYERRENFIYNLDFIATFDKTVDLTRQGGDI